MSITEIIKKLFLTKDLPDSDLALLIEPKIQTEFDDFLFEAAMMRRKEYYDNDIYIRGLIEFTNHCKNNCYYCGLRRDNACVHRYRLKKDDILSCTEKGYRLGFRTFVLQGGEDPWFTDDKLCEIVQAVHNQHPDCAVTLSVGERTKESYQKLFHSGAVRYLLRHETADEKHYASLHPAEMILSARMQCLFDLQSIGYQTGSGFMVGTPGQTADHIVRDLRFLQRFEPDMIGIGPFLPQSDTPFSNESAGSLWQTVRLISILRLMFPYALIPATTALATLDPRGRELGLMAGANVVMPNLSPASVRADYAIYDNKAYTGSEAAESLDSLKTLVKKIGLRIVTDIGNVKKHSPKNDS